jgi:hypothetical protein
MNARFDGSLSGSKRRSALPISLLLSAAAVLLASGTGWRRGPGELPFAGPEEAGSFAVNPKMESALTRLAGIRSDQGEAAAEDFARIRKIEYRDGSVRVVVAAANASPAALSGEAAALMLRARIAVLGGRVETRSRNFVQAFIPLDALESLAGDALVKYIRLPLRPLKLQVTSEGVSRTGADTWRNIPAYRTGAAAKICILDIGFLGYRNLLGTELPSSVTARSFRADGDIAAGEDHGTACAEIVHDMAPDAELYLVNFDTDVEEAAAVDWLVQQGVQVISYSLGWYNAGAGDGTGPICADVEYAASRNILWCSAAGNAAIDHWEGSSEAAYTDGWFNYAGTNRYLEFHVAAYDEVGVSLNWKDWGTWNGSDYSGSNQDYDLYLYLKQGSNYQLVDKSTNAQTGSQWPTEDIYGWTTDHDAVWAVSIKRVGGTKPVKLELFVSGDDQGISYAVAAHSIVVPADSASAIAVGATDWEDDSYHYYSSQGPTHDGRLKPDLTAPSGVSTATYGKWNFYGTSASAPHAAGACGLLRGKTPFPVKQVRALLEERAVDLGPAGPDDQFGYGRLNLKK